MQLSPSNSGIAVLLPAVEIQNSSSERLPCAAHRLDCEAKRRWTDVLDTDTLEEAWGEKL